MAASHREEKKSQFVQSSGSGKSYGTAQSSSHVRLTRPTVRHEVCSADTLQGLALRYGVSVSER